MSLRDQPSANAHRSAVDVGSMLEATARGEMLLPELAVALSAHCRGNQDAVWETLALVDQYFRRGRISADMLSAIKSQLHALVFRTDDAPAPPPKPEHRPKSTKEAADSDLPRDIALADKRVAVESATPPPQQVTGVEEVRIQKEVGAPLQSARSAIAADRPTSTDTGASPNGRVAPHIGTSSNLGANAGANRHMPIRELTFSPSISNNAKIVFGAGLLVAMLAILGYVFLTSKSAPSQINTAIAEPPQSETQPQSADATLPLVVEPAAPVQPANTTVGRADIVNHSEPLVNGTEGADTVPNAVSIASAAPLTGDKQTQPVIRFVVDPIVVDQGGSVARITVHRSSSTRRELLLPWRTLEGSAKAERDFVPTNDGVLSFGPGTRDAVILVPIVRDSTRQHSDWFEVEVTVGSAAAAEEPTVRATVVIESAQVARESDGSSPAAASDPP